MMHPAKIWVSGGRHVVVAPFAAPAHDLLQVAAGLASVEVGQGVARRRVIPGQ
jgi:hypothetical protein